jgi:hypothetical protein
LPDYDCPSEWIEYAPFAFWICEALRPIRFVELGTHHGYSYFAFCQAIDRLRIGTTAYAIDTWKGDEHTGFYDESVFRSVSMWNEKRYSAFSSLIRSTFDDAVDYFADGSVDLLHIDGRHFYDNVEHDFTLWRPKLTEDAVVLFHGTNVRERGFGVWKFFENLAARCSSFRFFHGQGLGILILGERTPASLAPLLEASPEAAHQIRAVYATLGAGLVFRSEVAQLRIVLADRDREIIRQRIAPAQDILAALETEAASHVQSNDLDSALRLIDARALDLFIRTQATGWISGSERLDRICLSIGRELRGVAECKHPGGLVGRRQFVYIVSQLYRVGGHTRLLEDLIAALPNANHQIIWTDGESAKLIANMGDVLRVREAVPLHVLSGGAVECLRKAFTILSELRPDVLVHLAHPNDPIAIALMQPSIARRLLMIHHADFSFALGRSLKGTVHVSLGRHFQDVARREWALETVFLPLTCREPFVTRIAGRPQDRPFLTVTSGSSHKFDLNGKVTYLDVLAERFTARDGSHVHIGPLSAEQMLRIDQHLQKLCCRERFVHREHVPYLATALTELDASVYIDSYPIGGAKAVVEAMAAGLPICAAKHDPNFDSGSFSYPECFWWTRPAQVGAIMAYLDATTLDRHAAISRSYFERNHSPEVFKRIVEALVN